MSNAPPDDRRMTEEEMAAYNGLMEGRLDEFGDLLALGMDAMHPHLQKRLLMMIDAWQGADYGLKVTHLKDYKLTLGFRRQKRKIKYRLADRMIELGAQKRGHLPRAAEAAISEDEFKHFGSVETAIRYYHQVKKARDRLDRFNRAHINKPKPEK